MDYAIPILVIALVLFISMHMAIAYEAANQECIINEYIDTDGNIVVREKFNISAFFAAFADRIEHHTTEIEFVESTPKFLAVAAFVCLIGVAYVYTGRRKFINNKEYGTSEWGTPKQIAHLLASNIKAREIKNIKKKRGLRKSEKLKKIADAKEKYADNANIIFTQTEKICMYNFELNNNTMVIGGSGSSKTRGYVLPNILQCCNSPYSPSIVVTDPKGEIIAKVGHYLEMQGYELKVLNLKEQNRSFCFNPFCYIMQDKYEEQISTFVSTIMDSRKEDKESKSNDPFWDDMSKVLLKSIFYAVYEGYPSEQRNMSTAMEMFRWFEVSDNDDRYRNPTKLDRFFEIFGDKNGVLSTAETILAFFSIQIMVQSGTKVVPKSLGELSGLNIDKKQMMEKIAIPLGSSDCAAITDYSKSIKEMLGTLEEQGGVNTEMQGKADAALNAIDTYIKARATRYANMPKPIGVELYEAYGDVNSNPALRNWEDFRTKCKGKTAQSVTATALAKLAPFDEEQIRRIFSKDEMELDLVGERKTALFIVLPPTNKAYNFIANVLYTKLFEQLEYCATVKHDQSLPVPVRFICDEFYNTGRIPNFENILSYARSFGIGISIILQSLDQIKEMYEKSWGVVLDNCSTFLYLGGIRHADTLEYITKLLGKGTFDKKTYSRTKGRQSSSSTSYDKIGRELLDSSEVQRLNKKKCLLFIQGYQPYMSRKFNYTSHKNYKYTSDSNKKYLYHYKTPAEKDAEKEKNITTNPHREEEQDKVLQMIQEDQKIEKTPHIVGNYDASATIEKISENVLFWGINSDEEAMLADNELQELDEIANLLGEDEKQNEELRTGVVEHIKSVKTPHIENKTDIVEVAQSIISMVEKEESVISSSDDDVPEEYTEEEIMQQLEEVSEVSEDDFEDDAETDIQTLVDSISDLSDNLADLLNSVNMQDLEQGDVNSAEEEE